MLDKINFSPFELKFTQKAPPQGHCQLHMPHGAGSGGWGFATQGPISLLYICYLFQHTVSNPLGDLLTR